MKILVFSDSHSSLRFMYRCVETCKADIIVHLGDHYDDAEALAEKYPHVYAAVGSQPDVADEVNDAVLEEYRKLCKLPKVKAIGEMIGSISSNITLRSRSLFHLRTSKVVGIRCIFFIIWYRSESRSASNIMVAIFNNSDGWNVKPPISNQRCAPFIGA